MVSFLKVLLAGAFAISSVAASPALLSDNSTLSVGSTKLEGSTPELDTHVSKRQNGRQLLQWAPDGTVLYLLGNLGTSLPAEIMMLIQGHGDGIMGGMLIETFESFLLGVDPTGPAMDLFSHAVTLENAVLNSVYLSNAVIPTFSGMWGFALSFVNGQAPDASDLASLVTAITNWAQQNGGVILVQQRANGFLPSAIAQHPVTGNTKRSRTDTCPAQIDLLQYATGIVPTDLDYGTAMSGAIPCTASSS